MNPHSLAAVWPAVAPALGNHLWQSTLFAAFAAILTLSLRKNHARARYWLWLTASLKFLVPFSWLVTLGSRLAWWRSPARAGANVYVVIDSISQPFTQPVAATRLAVAPTAAAFSLAHLVPAIVAGIWFLGFAAVLLMWCIRWRQISVVIRRSQPLLEGREVETLRRLERVAGLRQRMEMMLSRSTLEPGIFGMARPVLLWPEGISQHLGNAHLEAILAHELWHVRRRDNLAAAIHMAVEAVFWFHPLVWWLGARLVDERERACDEEVLDLGGERHVYAESILKVCEFCVGSPLACVSGVTGADLKKRMVHIMSERVAHKLDVRKKVLLAVAGALALAAPLVVGLVDATPGRAQSQSAESQSEDTSAPAKFAKMSITPSAESSSASSDAVAKPRMVRMMYDPDGFSASNVTLRSLIKEAYGVQEDQLIGGPDWLNTATFDIDARLDHPEPFQPGVPPNRERGQKMLQRLLADRTQLALHAETRQLQSYALVVAEGGPKLQPLQAGDSEVLPMPGRGGNAFFIESTKSGPNGPGETQSMRMQIGDDQVINIATRGISMTDLAGMLARQVGTNVVDKTGLKGRYHFNLQWSHAGQTASATDENSSDSAGSNGSLFTAIHDQLGLNLEPQTGPTQVLVIDHIEKPTAN